MFELTVTDKAGLRNSMVKYWIIFAIGAILVILGKIIPVEAMFYIGLWIPGLTSLGLVWKKASGLNVHPILKLVIFIWLAIVWTFIGIIVCLITAIRYTVAYKNCVKEK